jgi:hypothetical protein
LQGVEPRIEAVRGDKVFMGARLGDAAVFDHEDRIYAPDQPELVGDYERGPSFCKSPPVPLDGGGSLGVESGLGLVQDQDRCILSMARAMEMRCLCPPLRLSPRSESTVS